METNEPANELTYCESVFCNININACHSTVPPPPALKNRSIPTNDVKDQHCR